MIISNLATPVKINTRLLVQAMQQTQANVTINITKPINWQKFPYMPETCPSYITPPADTSVPWTSPFVVEIIDGDESNRAKFEQVIASHDPEYTDAEERQQLVTQKRAKELLEALLTLPDEYLAQIKAKFDALP